MSAPFSVFSRTADGAVKGGGGLQTTAAAHNQKVHTHTLVLLSLSASLASATVSDSPTVVERGKKEGAETANLSLLPPCFTHKKESPD